MGRGLSLGCYPTKHDFKPRPSPTWKLTLFCRQANSIFWDTKNSCCSTRILIKTNMITGFSDIYRKAYDKYIYIYMIMIYSYKYIIIYTYIFFLHTHHIPYLETTTSLHVFLNPYFKLPRSPDPNLVVVANPPQGPWRSWPTIPSSTTNLWMLTMRCPYTIQVDL